MMLGRQRTMYATVAVFALVAAVAAGPKSEQIRSATLDYISDGRQQEGIDKMSDYLSRQLKKSSRVPSRELRDLAVTAECVRFMELSKGAKPSAETVVWILESETRLHAVVDTLEPQDQGTVCMNVLEQLHRHDPTGCDKYFNLMLAISVVLDKPNKIRMHRQTGKNLLPYESDPTTLYDYFKDQYSSGQAKLEYESLGVPELVFVVHVPTAISELEWARDHVSGSLTGWGDKYGDIDYDRARLEESRYSWDSGTYTLENIQELGGICVDQAYYAVLTARAHGIPAIYFQGSGTSANHAWFAFMKKPGDWVLDVGRYQGGEYTTGHAINPQTHQPMTDHDVEYTCERSLHSSDAVQASAYISIAEVLLNRDPTAALRCARQARELSKRAMRPWQIEQQVLARQGDYEGLVELFADKKDVFRKYPDILVSSAREIETVLRKAGRNDAADRVLRSAAGAVDDDRDDITGAFEQDRINRIMASGDTKKARKELEQLLEERQDQGNKVFGLIRQYIALTKKSGQVHEAARFLEDYIDDLLMNYNFPPGYEAGLLQSLLSVIESDGQTKEAAKLRVRINRLKRL